MKAPHMWVALAMLGYFLFLFESFKVRAEPVTRACIERILPGGDACDHVAHRLVIDDGVAVCRCPVPAGSCR